MLTEAMDIFRSAGLPAPLGMQPPAWSLPKNLVMAMADVGVSYVAGARDILTPVRPGALTAMSGPAGLPLIEPARITGGIVHFTSNFQATSPRERAFEIIDRGGLLTIKCHIVKQVGTYVAKDGVDGVYMNYLDSLFRELENRYGETLWWTSMREITAGTANENGRCDAR